MEVFSTFFKNVGHFFSDRFAPFMKNYIVSKRHGYYIGLAASILLLVFAFMFLAVYGNSIYMDVKIVLFPILAALIFIGLSFYPPLEGVGGIVLVFGATAGVCFFALKTYPYLSEVFYAGFNAESFAALKIEYLLLFIFIIVALVLSFVCCFTKKSKQIKKEVEAIQ